MRSFFIALQFLTVLPVELESAPDQAEFCASMTCYPLVGAFLGLLSAAAGLLAGWIWGPGGQALAAVLALACLTGGLHLDGLADTADGLLSHRDRKRMMEIMRDSRLGTMGALALAAVLSLKVFFLSTLGPGQLLPALVCACAAARTGGLWMAWRFPYAHPTPGPHQNSARVGEVVARVPPEENRNPAGSAARSVVGKVGGRQVLAAALLLMLIFLVCHVPMAILLAGVGAPMLLGGWMCKLVGGITGDGIGAGIEMAEVVVLGLIAANT